MSEDLGQFGKYRILAEIGKGGFATVYRALDTTLDREVALKVLDPLLMRDATWVSRFHRAAGAVARLKHPHISPCQCRLPLCLLSLVLEFWLLTRGSTTRIHRCTKDLDHGVAKRHEGRVSAKARRQSSRREPSRPLCFAFFAVLRDFVIRTPTSCLLVSVS
jgi:serine/threonine protein kinase